MYHFISHHITALTEKLFARTDQFASLRRLNWMIGLDGMRHDIDIVIDLDLQLAVTGYRADSCFCVLEGKKQNRRAAVCGRQVVKHHVENFQNLR